jgi:DNA-directed RNA polymerase subunit RPC12/RpoP
MLTFLCTDCAKKSPQLVMKYWEEAERRYGAERPPGCIHCGKAIEFFRRSYECWDCDHKWEMGFTQWELISTVDDQRQDACERCGQRVGMGFQRCRKFGQKSLTEVSHWHIDCDVLLVICPSCGEKNERACVC